ncbi:MAG: hypothetical protein IH948_00240 [Bacteroidetes bacterium]|nr:hypothetical protein [Bacteroidota bacterium]
MRKYLPTIAELADRLSIVTLKSIKLKNKEEYEQEAKLIIHDLDELMKTKTIKNWGHFIRAIQIGAIANEIIWQNETLAREGGRNQDHLLPFTHSVNSVRMHAGNVIASQLGERKDLNLDRLSDEVTKQRGYNFGSIF